MAARFSLQAIFTARDNASRVFARIYGTAEKMQRKFAGALGSLDKANGKVLSGLTAIGQKAKLATLAIGGIGAAAALSIGKAGADFEQAITNVGAVSLMTRDQIADLEKKALELGASTKFSATEVANAMEMMGKAGFTNQDILQGVGGILAAAAAEGAGLEETASNISNVLKGMGKETTEAARVADVLTLASARTNSSISSLGQSMANVSSTARQLGVPLEDTVAMVALLQDVGLDASEAGSSVATMLTKLSAPTKEMQKEMKSLGVSFQDAKGNMLAPVEVLAQLAKGADKSGGNMKQVAFFAELVGMRGQKAALNLQELFRKGKFEELTKELKNAAGAAEKMSGIRQNTLLGDMEQLGGAIDSVKIALFNTQAGPLRSIVQRMTAWVTANQGLITGKFVEYLQKILDHLPQIVMWTKRIGIGIGIFLAWTTAVKVATIATSAWGAVMTIASGAMTVLRTAVSITTTVIGLLRAAVLSETAATVASTAAKWAATGARWALNAALTVGRLATTQITGAMIVNAAATVGNTVATWANQVAQWAKTAAVTAYNVVIRAGTVLIGLWTAATSLDTIKSGLATAATWLRNAAQVALNVTTGIGTTAVGVYAVATGTATTASYAAAGGATAMNAAFLPLIATLGAVAAAFVAVKLAYDQAKDFEKMSEGLGISGTIEQMVKQGTWDPAKAIDTYQNQQAKGRAMAEGTMDPFGRMYSKEELAARQITETQSTEKVELTIKDETGKAQITKAPKEGKGLTMQQTGAM